MKIIIFRTDKMGDMIVSSPVIGAIKAAHPEVRIMVVASSYNAPTIAGLPHVDGLVIYDKKMKLGEKAFVLKKLRAFKPTHSLVLSPKNDCFILGLLSGANVRGGILMEYRLLPRLFAPLLLTHTSFIPRDRKGAHLAQRILNLARKMGIASGEPFPYAINESTEATRSMGEKIKSLGIDGAFVAVHPADKWLSGGWGTGDIRDFLIKLREKLKLPVIVTAGGVDKIVSAALEKDFPVLRNLSFHEWVAIFRHSSVAIAPDCGAVHIACALQKPVLALYTKERATFAIAEFGPWGTAYATCALDNPVQQTDILIEDVSRLMEKQA
jgi:ADP-heptose:LPS heptosyltransferase